MLWLRCLRGAGAAVGLALALTTARAGAAAPGVVPPSPLAPVEASYPSGAYGDGEVVLDLVVTRDGRAERAVVVQGEEPFASAALAAAPSWRFAPATRGGVAVPARVRVRVAFTERRESAEGSTPAAPTTGGEAAAPPAAAPSGDAPARATAPAAPAEAVDEVRIRVPPMELGRTTLRASDVRKVPGAFGEIVRAAEMLPGVAPYVSGLPFLYVRGAMPGSAGYFLDGFRLPLLYHFGLGVSVVHPALVDHFDFFAGAPPARYGRSVGVFDATTRAPATRPTGEISVRAVDTSALVEAPFAGGRGAVLVAGRYGYPGPLVSRLSPGTRLEYSNYQARVSWAFSPRHRVTVLGLGVRDVFDQPEADTLTRLFSVDTQSHRLDVRYDGTFADGASTRVGVTFGQDAFPSYARYADSVQARALVEVPIGDEVRVRAGLDGSIERTRADPPALSGAAKSFPSLLVDGLVRAAMAVPIEKRLGGAWADVVLRPTRAVELVPGFRVDAFRVVRASSINLGPRLASRVRLAPGLAYVGSLGVVSREPSGAFPVAGVADFAADLAAGAQRTYQIDAGLEVSLPGDVTVRGSVFRNTFRAMELGGFVCLPFGGDGAVGRCRADGAATGFELLVRRSFSQRLSGWVSYTHTRMRLRAPFQGEFDGPADRRHTLNALVGYDLGAGFSAGARVVFYTGAPIMTQRLPSFGAQILPWSERPDAFLRVDLRVEKRFQLSETTSIAIVAEWLNATLAQEPEIACDSRQVSREEPNRTVIELVPQCRHALRPLVSAPSLALEGRF